MNIEYIEFSSPGLVRSENQDSIFSAVEKEYGLFAVADGMGGHTNGGIASQRLIESLKNWWNSFCVEIYDFDRCYEDLRNVINDVHESIYEEFTEKGTTCGTTIALVFIYSDRYIIINSGDSRVYSKDGLKAKQESKDHVFGVESIISGAMTAEEVENHPNKNKLTAAVGCKKELKIYIASAPLKTDQFFICSDGVYKYCKDSDISSAMRKKDIISYVSNIVNGNGASDNFSFISVKIIDKEMKANALKKKYLAAAICTVALIGIVTVASILPKNKPIEADSEMTVETATQTTAVVAEQTKSETPTQSTIETTGQTTYEIASETDDEDDMRIKLSKANEALSEGEYDLAIELFAEITKEDKFNSEAYIGLAISHIGRGDVESAVSVLKEFAENNDITIEIPENEKEIANGETPDEQAPIIPSDGEEISGQEIAETFPTGETTNNNILVTTSENTESPEETVPNVTETGRSDPVDIVEPEVD